ncbi:non-ribosomal peptide synthetase, partial [Streptosporangium sp. NPDC001681]|uniref:non-ribosomal peptide synthetase n=1 Tax=Streptosporangium sp. NPDC001681 TaxID=3154395 RepID=UPI003334A1A3
CGLHNQWGATEVSIDSTEHACVSDDGARREVPVGRPISNNRVHVLDADMRPLPAGVAGDLYLGGVGLARCYWCDPRRTAESFVPDPFSFGGRLYRTGDRGLRRADDEIVFLGRQDHQVKIRGIRIELGEIEQTLRLHPEVAEAVVTVWQRGTDDRVPVAYLTPAGDRRPEPEALREFLAVRLPLSMVPASYDVLDVLPLTASGKVDRGALPAPAAGEASPREVVPPRTEAEQLVAEVWAEVLDRADLDVHDSFFALGGHSLSAVRVVTRLRRALDIELPLSLIFEHPRLAALAKAVETELAADIAAAETTGATPERR